VTPFQRRLTKQRLNRLVPPPLLLQPRKPRSPRWWGNLLLSLLLLAAILLSLHLNLLLLQYLPRHL